MPRTKLNQHPAAKLRSRNADRSISGIGSCNERRITPPPQAAQRAASSSISALAQPCCGASLRSSCKLARKTASSGNASRSTEPKARRSGRSTSTAQATRRATTIPGGTLIRNSQCQEKRSVINPPTLGPRVGASIARSPAHNIARSRAGHWNIKKTAENTSGNSAPPEKPCTTRAAISNQKPEEAAQATLAAVKPQTQAKKAPRVDSSLVSQPVSGIATISAIR